MNSLSNEVISIAFELGHFLPSENAHSTQTKDWSDLFGKEMMIDNLDHAWSGDDESFE